MEDGIAAAQNQLLINQNKHGLTTVAGQINRWAPASDGNNTTAYTNTVAQKIGVSPTQTINIADPTIAQNFITAQIGKEGSRPVDPAIIASGIAKGNAYYASRH